MSRGKILLSNLIAEPSYYEEHLNGIIKRIEERNERSRRAITFKEIFEENPYHEYLRRRKAEEEK